MPTDRQAGGGAAPGRGWPLGAAPSAHPITLSAAERPPLIAFELNGMETVSTVRRAESNNRRAELRRPRVFGAPPRESESAHRSNGNRTISITTKSEKNRPTRMIITMPAID